MRFDYGYEEEQADGKSYRLAVLGRLLPFLRPYMVLLLASSALVLLITVVELAIPYFSKVVVDRFIVPVHSVSEQPFDGKPRKKAMVVVDLRQPQVREIVAAYPRLFRQNNGRVSILYQDLKSLDQDQLAAIRKPDMEALFRLTLVFGLFILADFALNFLQRYLMEYAGHKVMHDLRCRLYRHVQRLPLAAFTANPVARLVTRLTNDVQNMHEMLTSVLSMFFKDLVLLAGIAGLLLTINSHLASLALAVLPLVALAAFGFSHRMRRVFRQLRIKVAEINTRFAETVTGIKVIQAYGRRQANQEFFEDLNRSYFKLGMEQIHVLALFLPAIEMIGVAVTAMLVYFGGRSVLAGSLSLGEMVAFLAYMKIFFRPIRDLADKYNIFQNAMASAERIVGLLSQSPENGIETGDLKVAARGRPAFQSLQVKNIVFGYAGDEPVLKGISLELNAGQTIALVGPTGAGKSTLVNLLLGFYSPWQGAILVNGVSLRDWNRQKFQSMISWVPQESLFFNASIKDNVFAPDRNWTVTEMDRIIDMAACRDLVSGPGRGLETFLTEGAGNLSSGQRQLLAVARALARDPELIIMDEATAHIDSHTEYMIQKAMAKLVSGRSCIMVAHRLSTARMADRIYVISQGRIVESGTHETLIADGGFYSRLWQLQQSR